MNQRLIVRVAVVTGAGTGIGVGIARRLAQEGARVVVSAASSIQGARDLADEITASGGSALAVQADFRDPTTAIDVVDTAVSNFGGVDVLVNNAGYTLDKPFLETTSDDWSSLFNINVQAMIASAHAAAPHMIERCGVRHHQHQLGAWRPARQRARDLRRNQGRHQRLHPRPRRGAGATPDHLNRHRPRAPFMSNAMTATTATSKLSARPSPTSASAIPRTLPEPPRTWPRMKPATSPAPSSTSTAVVTSAMAVTD